MNVQNQERKALLATPFYRSAQQQTAKQLRENQPQSFYQIGAKKQHGEYPQGFYRQEPVINFQ